MAVISPIHTTMPNQQRGITLLELIVTIIIIGILSATILPRFSGSDGYEEYAYRAQAIAILRHVQLRAMQQQSTNCNNVEIVADGIGIPNIVGCTVTPTTELLIEHEGVTFSNVGDDFVVTFDKLGLPGGSCVSGCTIDITGLETVQIKIESQGYIHAL